MAYSFAHSGRLSFNTQQDTPPFLISREHNFRQYLHCEYEDGARAVVVDLKTGLGAESVTVQRFLIDTARDYVCPLIRFFDKSGAIVKEFVSSDYELHQESGLWFPRIYGEFEYGGGEVLLKGKQYSLVEGSLELNSNISPKDFQIEIPAGAVFRDSFSDKLYRAETPVSVDFGGERISPSLYEELVEVEKPLAAVGPSTFRRMFIIANMIAIPVVLVLLFMRARRSKKAVMVLLVVFLYGCSRPNEPQSTLSLTPEIIELGRIREKQVATCRLEIANNSDHEVTLSQAKAGCSCASLSYTPVTLAPRIKKEHEFSLTVNRYGKFSSSVVLYADDNQTSLVVPVKGEVLRDLWVREPVLYARVDDQSLGPQLVFSVFTILPSDIQLRVGDARTEELFRKTKSDGVTEIRLRVFLEKPKIGRDCLVIHPSDSSPPIKVSYIAKRSSGHEIAWLSPPSVSLGEVPRGKACEVAVFTDQDVRIATVNGVPGVVELSRESAGRKKTITLMIADQAPAGMFEGEIMIERIEDGQLQAVEILGKIL